MSRRPDQSVGPGELATPETGGRAGGASLHAASMLQQIFEQTGCCASGPERDDGGVVWSSDGAPFAQPPRVVFLFVTGFASFNKCLSLQARTHKTSTLQVVVVRLGNQLVPEYSSECRFYYSLQQQTGSTGPI